jgi:hypothetical protein
MPGTVRTGAPEAGTETAATGAQTRLRDVTVSPPFAASIETVNGPAPASSPLEVLPFQS